MTDLNTKICDVFPGLVVRKDLVKAVKGNAIVPSYVLEYLLGQYCATNDEDSIQSGIRTVKEILAKHFVHRNEAGLVRSTIREKGRFRIIDKVSVALNDKKDCYEAEFSNLGIKKVLIDSATVKQHPKVLVHGVWVIADIEYEHSDEKDSVPWKLDSLKPIQMSHFDYDAYLEARKQFTLEEWIDVLLQSMGFNPEFFSERSKLTQLVRLIPFCERNYNLIELGPKGTGKSHIYSEFSPHGILLSGGEVTVAKLFVNNSNGRIGLVGYWDIIAFDEFAGKTKKVDKALVDIMKNYLANKTFSRGVDTMGADASMAFVGNTEHSLPYMLKHSDLFEALPQKFYDSAFLDRLHFYVPGWEVDIIRGEMFSSGFGFVVDYFAEILRHLRNQDYSDQYNDNFILSSDMSSRDQVGINKTFSGLMKILFPQGGASKDEIERILKLAIEGRKRVKDHIIRMDSTFTAADFSYADTSGKTTRVKTLEELEYPRYYYQSSEHDQMVSTDAESPTRVMPVQSTQQKEEATSGLTEGHVVVLENQRGVSFTSIFGAYINGAQHITITDAYIRRFHQVRNLMELIETIVRMKEESDEVVVSLVTAEDDYEDSKQREWLDQIQAAVMTSGIKFAYSFEDSNSIHARHIVTDTGWKILLDRGLDIFQPYEMNDTFQLANRIQEKRPCRSFEVTYVKAD